MLCIFICPADREQYDFLRFFLLPVGFFSVTAVFSLLPGFCLRYLATPLRVIPAPALVGRLSPDFTLMPFMLPFVAISYPFLWR